MSGVLSVPKLVSFRDELQPGCLSPKVVLFMTSFAAGRKLSAARA